MKCLGSRYFELGSAANVFTRVMKGMGGGRTCLVLVLAVVACVVASDGGSGSPLNSRSGAEGRCGGTELAANYPTGNRYKFYYSLAQLFRVRKTCRITSLTSSFFAPCTCPHPF